MQDQSRDDQAGPSKPCDNQGASKTAQADPKPSTSQVGGSLAYPKQSTATSNPRKLSSDQANQKQTHASTSNSRKRRLDLANPRLSQATALPRKRAASRSNIRTRVQTVSEVNRNEQGPSQAKNPRLWTPESDEYAGKGEVKGLNLLARLHLFYHTHQPNFNITHTTHTYIS